MKQKYNGKNYKSYIGKSEVKTLYRKEVKKYIAEKGKKL